MSDRQQAQRQETASGGAAGEPGAASRLAPWVDWRRKRFWILALALAWSLFGFLGVPWLVEKTAGDLLAESGRSLQVSRVTANPWLLRLRIEELEIRDKDQAMLLSFGEFFADLQVSSLFRWAWTFRDLRLAGLRVEEERFEGLDTRLLRLVEDLAGPPGPEAPETEPPTPEPPPRLILQRAELIDGRLRFVDRVAEDFEATLGPISVTVEDLQTLPDHSGRQQVEIRTAEGGRISWRGDLSVVPPASTGQVLVEGRSLADLFNYSSHYLPFSTTGDGMELSFGYRFSMRESGPEFSIEQLAGQWRGSRLTADGESEPVLSLERVELADGYLHWPGRAGTPEAGLGAVVVEGLRLKAGLEADGSPDLLRLVPDGETAPGGGDGSAVAAGDDSANWRLAIDELLFEDALVEFRDRSLAPPVELALEELRFRLRGIDNRPETSMPAEASLNLSSGGSLAFEGAITALPSPIAEGRLTLSSVALPVIQPYLAQVARVELRSGLLDLDADLRHDPVQPLAIGGSVTVQGFDLQDLNQNERLAGWATLQMDRFEADLAARRVETSVIELLGPFGRLHIAEDLSTNLEGLLIESDEEPAELPGIVVGGFDIRDAALDFSDFSLPLPFQAAIRSMAGEISTLATDSTEPARVNLEGQVNEYGLARIEGELNAWSPTDLTDIAMVFRNLEVARLSPYTVQFAGYEVAEGRMDLDLNYEIRQQQLLGDNQIVVREMILGEKIEHPDAGSLPLGLAIALLKDSDGVIDIEVPVEGDLNDPEFRIGGVIWRALGNLISKVVTAPFRLLGNLVGVESEDFGRMEFPAGRSDLSPPDREDLVKLGEAMLERPELALTVAGQASPALDRPALQDARLERLLEERLAGGEGSLDAERRALETMFGEQLPGESLDALRAAHMTTPAAGTEEEPAFDETAYLAELRERLARAQPVADADLLALADARAGSVAGALLEAQPGLAERVLTEPSALSDETAEEGYVPLELGVSVEGSGD